MLSKNLDTLGAGTFIKYIGLAFALCVFSITSQAQVRIVNGQETEEQEFPNVAALLYDVPDESARDRQFCGGTVIAPKWILTAAHCLYTPEGNLVPASGINALVNTTSLDFPGEDEISVTAIYIHPNYQTSPIPYNDIALLKLATPTDVTAITLSVEDANWLAGNPGVVVGWGATGRDDEGEIVYAVEQRKITLPIASRSVCNSVADYGGFIAREHICAGRIQGGIDSCYGDSGGPLFYFGEQGMRQIGIVSFGNECAIPYSYGVYTAVDYYTDWIEGITSIYGPNQQADSIAIYEPADTGSLSAAQVYVLCFLVLISAAVRRLSRRTR